MKIITFFFSLLLLTSKCFGQKIETQSYITIDVYTGELPDSGTDRSVKLIFEIGDEVVTIEDISKYITGNALERGTTDRFTYPVPNLGEIRGATALVKWDNTIDDKWLLSKVIFTHPNGTKTRLECNSWLSNEINYGVLLKVNEADTKGEFRSNRTMVKVKTGKLSKAGTNANVYLTVHTEHGHSSPYKLNTRINTNAFENGDTDVAYIDLPYFEEIHSINISHDNKGAGAGWFLESIKIMNAANKEFNFKCHCWLEGDHNQRTLLHDNFEEPEIYFIQSKIGGKFLDLQWGNTKDMTPLHLWQENKGKAQQFYIEKSGSKYHKIKTALGIKKYVSFTLDKAEGIITISDRQPNSYDKWIFERIPNSYYYLIKTESDLYLDVKWGSENNGTPIWLWPRNAGPAQQWRILKLEDGNFVPVIL